MLCLPMPRWFSLASLGCLVGSFWGETGLDHSAPPHPPGVETWALLGDLGALVLGGFSPLSWPSHSFQAVLGDR